MSRVDDVAVSDHAHDRWAERAPETEQPPVVAWVDAAGMPGHVAVTCGVDEVRYHRETNTALLRRGMTLVTVLSMDPMDIDTSRGHAVREAVLAQYGTIEQSRSTDDRFTESES